MHRKRRARRQLAWKELRPAPEQHRQSQPELKPEQKKQQPEQQPEPEPEPELEPELEPQLENPVYDWNPEELAQQAVVLKHLLVRCLPFLCPHFAVFDFCLT